MNFITLPSGLRINTAHIIHYGQSEDEGQIKIVLTDEPTPWLETMTLGELDALLSPPSSPIVDGVVNLDNLRPGKACCFTYEGKVKHGVIIHFWTDETREDACLRVKSDGVRYDMWTSENYFTIV